MNANADPKELEKFAALAQGWWDPKGSSRPLHELNPLRLQYVERIASAGGRQLATMDALDVGCGGGILSEAIARKGARVLGIDLAPAVLQVATLHALEGGVAVRYREIAVDALAREQPQSFDIITCMEMLEHVPDPASIVQSLAALVRPGGDIVVSTLHRTLKAFLVAIVGAEHLARVLPRGTHEYLKFIRPSELARWGRSAGLELRDLTGISYNPLTRAFSLSARTDVNYLAHFRRSGSPP
jgi:2-polyprenyl-6-hydroxyphenyl methylase/3-demethylubiquinone-9 3-methyltransferase